MSKCIVSGDQFINFVFSPCIGLLVSSDVEEICQKDNLTFEELLRPFCQITRDGSFIWFLIIFLVAIRDSSNLLHTIRNLRLKFVNIMNSPPSHHTTALKLWYVVNACSNDASIRTTKVSDNKHSILIPGNFFIYEI